MCCNIYLHRMIFAKPFRLNIVLQQQSSVSSITIHWSTCLLHDRLCVCTNIFIMNDHFTKTEMKTWEKCIMNIRHNSKLTSFDDLACESFSCFCHLASTLYSCHHSIKSQSSSHLSTRHIFPQICRFH